MLEMIYSAGLRVSELVNLRVDDMVLAHKVFTEALRFSGNLNKTIVTYKMENHSEVHIYHDPEIFRESPTHVYLTVSPEKVANSAQILKESGVKYVIYHENVGEGIINTLEWGMEDGSSLRLESFEDSYWTR